MGGGKQESGLEGGRQSGRGQGTTGGTGGAGGKEPHELSAAALQSCEGQGRGTRKRLGGQVMMSGASPQRVHMPCCRRSYA